MAEQYLKDLFSRLTDEEIAARIRDGLTQEAYQIASGELQSRGIAPPSAQEQPATPEAEPPYLGDRVILARNLTSTEAYALAVRLTEAGIDAQPADINTARIWANAMDGAKVRVPQSQLAQAQQVLEAFRRGEFALGGDFDVGSASE